MDEKEWVKKVMRNVNKDTVVAVERELSRVLAASGATIAEGYVAVLDLQERLLNRLSKQQ